MASVKLRVSVHVSDAGFQPQMQAQSPPDGFLSLARRGAKTKTRRITAGLLVCTQNTCGYLNRRSHSDRPYHLVQAFYYSSRGTDFSRLTSSGLTQNPRFRMLPRLGVTTAVHWLKHLLCELPILGLLADGRKKGAGLRRERVSRTCADRSRRSRRAVTPRSVPLVQAAA